MSGDTHEAPELQRTLGTFDLVFLNIAAVVALRWLSFAAHLGPSSIALWLFGLVTFFIPSALTVLELSSRLPKEGGLYIWAKAAFGEMHAFIVGWAYWVSNLVFFPSLLLFIAGVSLYIHGGSWLALAESQIYNRSFGLITLWVVTFLNIIGLRRAKWLQNAGGMATWLTGALVLGGGVLAWYRFGWAAPITGAALLPHFGSFATSASFAALAFAYSGLELGPILGGEIKNPRRSIARATLVSCVVISILYIGGTAALLAALPAGQISLISGIPQALTAVGLRVGLISLGAVGAALLTVSQVGTLNAWVSGTARLPFLFGLHRYLPAVFGAVHPRFGSPYVALLCQGVLATIVLLAATSGSAVHEAFVVLIDMSIILVFVPLIYMFVALPVLRYRAMGNQSHVTVIPGGLVACGITAVSGVAVTLFGIAAAMIPPTGDGSRALFALKVVGGCTALIIAGLPFYFAGQQRRKREWASREGNVI